MSRMNKTVSFNTTDEQDVRRLEHAEQINPLSGKKQNFSKYVKKLIDEDIEKKNGANNNEVTNSKKPHVNPDKDFYTMEIKEAQGSFL